MTTTRSDPHAGSPTSTLLRLLPLLDCEYCAIFRQSPSMPSPPESGKGHDPRRSRRPKVSTDNPSQATTGGVYKNQGRILCVLLKRGYKTFLVHGVDFQPFNPDLDSRCPEGSPIPSDQAAGLRAAAIPKDQQRRGRRSSFADSV